MSGALHLAILLAVVADPRFVPAHHAAAGAMAVVLVPAAMLDAAVSGPPALPAAALSAPFTLSPPLAADRSPATVAALQSPISPTAAAPFSLRRIVPEPSPVVTSDADSVPPDQSAPTPERTLGDEQRPDNLSPAPAERPSRHPSLSARPLRGAFDAQTTPMASAGGASKNADVPAETAVGEGGAISGDAALAEHASGVRARIDRRKRYPAAARPAGRRGVARLDLRLDRDGRLVALDLVESSGWPALDQAALTAARSAAPFSPLPATSSRDEVVYRIAIRFAP